MPERVRSQSAGESLQNISEPPRVGQLDALPNLIALIVYRRYDGGTRLGGRDIFQDVLHVSQMNT